MADLISKIKGVDNVTYDLQDKISIFGGTNYYKNSTSIGNLSNTSTYTKDTSIKGFTLKATAASASCRLSNVITQKGWWIFTGQVKTSTGAGNLTTDFCDVSATGSITLSTNYQNFSFICNEISRNIDSTYNFIDLNFSGLTANAIISFKDVKIEIGTKPTEWTPAPQDLVTYSSETLEFFQ